MFGLKSIFAAMTRLATALNRSAELFEAANDQLAERLGFDEPANLPELSAPEQEPAPARNGRRAKA